MISSGVGDDQQSGLLEGPLDLIGEGAGSVTAGDGGGAGRRRELQDGALSVRAGGNHAHVSCGGERGGTIERKEIGKGRKEIEGKGKEGGEEGKAGRKELVMEIS